MRIGVSNIAWDPAEDDQISELLTQHAVDAVDIAPGKYFPDPAAASPADIDAVREWWQARGVEITGMQSLLFGTVGLNVFGSIDTQEVMVDRLSAVCSVAGRLGATRLVFGSPRNRDRGDLRDDEAAAVAVPFFRRLGDIALNMDTLICLEPNPSEYGANFMTTSASTASIVEAVDHPAIRMQLDVGALTMNGETATSVVATYGHLIGHVHASEPHLVPLGDGASDHQSAADAMAAALPDHLVMIEMVATDPGVEPHADSIGRSISVASLAYRQGIHE